MTHTNIIFNETVFGDWSMKNPATISTNSRSGSKKHNKPGTKTMQHIGMIQEEPKNSNLLLSTHTSKFFGEKDESISPLQENLLPLNNSNNEIAIKSMMLGGFNSRDITVE
jgi:hypothetical protein